MKICCLYIKNNNSVLELLVYWNIQEAADQVHLKGGKIKFFTYQM